MNHCTCHNDVMLPSDTTFSFISAAFGTDHSDSDCFLCVFLTHGDDGVIYGRDGVLPIQVFFDCFRGDKCASLVGKPKIFLLQVS